MPRPTAIDSAVKFRAALAGQEAQAAERMGQIYLRIYQGLERDIAALADDIAGVDNPSRGKLLKLARLERMLRQVEEQAGRFGVVVQAEADLIRSAAIRQGAADALALIDASLPSLAPELRNAVKATFTKLPLEAIETATGLLSDDSALTERLQKGYGEFVAGQVRDGIINGIAKGQNPRTIAGLLRRNVLNGLGKGLSSALTTVRTAQIKSYQTANHMTFAANEKIVPKWTWVATLDGRTCMSCIAQHGSEHPVAERLNDHYNGLCVPIPRTITYKDLGIDLPEPVEPFESGEQWFKRQPESAQRDMMGPGRFELWKAKGFDFRELSAKYDDPVYGELLRETSLKELAGNAS